MIRVRRAQDKDIKRVTELLAQVLELHADLRPDLFIHGTAGRRSQFAVLTVGDLRRLRYRRALTAHPIDVVLYSGIIKRIQQTVEVCGILFCGCEPPQTRRSDC